MINTARVSQAPYGSPAWFVDMVDESRNGIFMREVDMTPELAAFIIGVNFNNRTQKRAKLKQYTADMKAGKWTLNGEPFIISVEGSLNDGQHRCQAVIDSKTTIRTVIIFGLPTESRLTVDQGAMRTAGDFLKMEDVPSANLAASIARMAIAYERSGGRNLADAPNITSADIRDRVASDESIADACTWGNSNQAYARKVGLVGSVISFAYYELSKIDLRDASHFLEGLCRGTNLSMKDPAFALREKLMGTKGKTPRDRMLAMIFRAWNFYRREMKVSKSALTQELPFPTLR